jgi:RNA polymerase sigma factor (TIGR02999 family)
MPHDSCATIDDAFAGDAFAGQTYARLLQLARRYMARSAPEDTLQPTALVHEAWMRVRSAGDDPDRFNGREHFVSSAAQAMRHILVDHARARSAQKRGAGRAGLPLDHVLASFEERALDVVALDDALSELTAMDPELGRIVELRFFAGLTIGATAQAIGVSKPTIERRWRVARMWLRDRMPQDPG